MKAHAGDVSSVRFTVRAFLALASITVAQSTPAQSQGLQDQTAIMVAFVTDTAGKPLSGAEIQVAGTSLRGNTDDDGRVALLAVPAGKAILKVRRLGFAELTIPVSVTPGSMPEARYKLMPLPVLSKVVVRSSELKPDRYAKTQRFDAFYRRRAEGR